MTAPAPLAEFLRARRALITADVAEVYDPGPRRVPGLRRDEVAMLAGISPHYYTRLEQGRDRHPSPQVVDALARALQLDDDARRHMHALARAEGDGRSAEPLPEGMEHLLDAWSATPAVVLGPLYEVVAANDLASALSPHYTPGTNALRELFLNQEMRVVLGDGWPQFTAACVAGLRAYVGPDLADPRVTALVEELLANSERFRECWDRHDARPAAGSSWTTFHHPIAGELRLRNHKFPVAGPDGVLLVVFCADPGTPASEGLARLAAHVRGASPRRPSPVRRDGDRRRRSRSPVPAATSS